MGHKSSKSNVAYPASLNQTEILELCQETGFTEEELIAWHT